MEYSNHIRLSIILICLCLLKPATPEYSSELLTVLPSSQNVSLASNVLFSCGNNDSSLDTIWFFSSNIAASVFSEQLVEGGSVFKYIGTLVW